MKVDVSGLLSEIVPNCETDEAFQTALLDKCRQRFGDHADSIHEAVMRIIEGHAKHSGGSHLEAARQIARSRATLDRQTQTIRLSSINDAPPDIREKIKQLMAEGKTSMSTSRTVRYDSKTDGPPPPEVLEAVRRSLTNEGEISTSVSAPSGKGSWLKWVLLIVFLLIVVAIVLLCRPMFQR